MQQSLVQRTAIILAFHELASLVDKWRLKSVPDAKNGVPPHITLLFPWKTPPISESDISTVAEACSGITPFYIEFNGLKHFEAGTVYLSLAQEQEVLNLSRKIRARFPQTPPYAGRHQNLIPHLTVAQGDSLSVDKLIADVKFELGEVLPCSCQVNTVSIIEQNAAYFWQTRAKISLT